jgi:hypothetical protein
MAFAFQSKSWSISGEKEFENGMVLLNPSIVVNQVVVAEQAVYLSLVIKENGGVFNHNFNIQYDNTGGITDLDTIVDSAVSAAFPDATAAVE